MPSIQFEIDFGEPDGTLEEMGCEGLENAQQVIDALRSDARVRDSVKEALDAWDLLDFGRVRVTFTPDVPEELQVQSVWVHPDKPPEFTPELLAKHQRLWDWVAANQTTAEWSDHGS